MQGIELFTWYRNNGVTEFSLLKIHYKRRGFIGQIWDERCLFGYYAFSGTSKIDLFWFKIKRF